MDTHTHPIQLNENIINIILLQKTGLDGREILPIAKSLRILYVECG